MMEKTKIQFSAEELELMQNAQWILTKNRIIEKVASGLQELALQLQAEVAHDYPAISQELLKAGYKVSRGERYKGVPYLILDFPRIFGRQDVLAIRVMFWWGKQFSVTLHTKGWYAEKIKKHVEKQTISFERELFVSCTGDEWNHDTGEGNYRSVKDLSPAMLEGLFKQTEFLKLSTRVSLMQWEEVEKILYRQVHQFLLLLNVSFQGDEKDL